MKIKKIAGNLWIWILAVVLVLGNTAQVWAANTQSTGYTTTLSTMGDFQISQDAYLPYGTFLSLDLNHADDLFILDDIMYIADTGNSRCLVIDIKTSETKVIGEDFLNKPRGIAADEEGRIYVADYGNAEAYRFGKDGVLEQTFVKPLTPNFGKTASFNPAKVIPSGDGGVYLINEGTTAGLVYMNKSGEFLGYFGAKNVFMSSFEALLRVILNQQQLLRFLNKTPPSYSSIFRGADGFIYSIEKGTNATISRLNLGGFDMFEERLNQGEMLWVDDARDICVTPDSRMFIVEQSGMITEMTKEGYVLSRFGGPARGEDREGLFYVTSGIGVDNSGKVYVLDYEKNYIQVFEPTASQTNMHRAINLYDNGKYDESLAILNQVIDFNNTSFFAHYYAGKIYMQMGEYDKAAEHYKTANAYGYYSQAYWEIRNVWLQKYITAIFIVVFVLAVGFIGWQRYKRRKGQTGLIRGFYLQKLHKYRLVRDFAALRYAAFHPADNAYEVKVGRTGGYLAATLIYLLFFAVFVLWQIGSGFLYSIRIQDFHLMSNLLYYVGAIGLFCIGNYFISSIHDGKGTFKAIYVTLAYSLAPAILMLPFVIVFSNFATYDDYFLIQVALMVSLAWCVCNEVVALIEIHRYSFWETVKNIALSALFMVVTIIIVSLSYLLIKQIYDFFASLLMEVMMRG